MASSGPNAPGTVAEAVYDGTPPNLNFYDRVKASDNSISYTVLYNRNSKYLLASNFGFEIPADATINGIEVGIERKTNFNTSTVYALDAVVSLIKDGTVSGDNKADTSTKWSTTEATFTYGASNSLWGLELSPSDVNNSGFGATLVVYGKSSGKSAPYIEVDFMSITVTYTEGGGGASAVPAIMNSYRQRRN